MKGFLNAEHCLAIAGAFIAIVGVCATLVSAANSKSDALVKRYRDVTKEFRDEPGGTLRKIQLEEQIALFVERVKAIYRAQQFLFWAIGFFTLSIVLFVFIGLYLTYRPNPEEAFYSITEKLLFVIAGSVACGTLLMVATICCYFRELKDAKRTFEIETRDCRRGGIRLRLRRSREGYNVFCSDSSICWVRGETEEEALGNIQDIVVAYLEPGGVLREKARAF